MEENINNFIQLITNNLDLINTDVFLNNIKNIKEIKECYQISNNFCNTIIDSKNKILLYLSEEKNKIVNNKAQMNTNLKSTNNDLNKLIIFR